MSNPTAEPPLPEPPKRETIGRYAPHLWSYKGELHEFPISAHDYTRDLLRLCVHVILNWQDTSNEYDKALCAAINEWCKPYE